MNKVRYFFKNYIWWAVILRVGAFIIPALLMLLGEKAEKLLDYFDEKLPISRK